MSQDVQRGVEAPCQTCKLATTATKSKSSTDMGMCFNCQPALMILQSVLQGKLLHMSDSQDRAGRRYLIFRMQIQIEISLHQIMLSPRPWAT